MPKHSFYKKNLVDLVIVNKRSHQMLLLKNDQVVKKYWIALSNRPQGAKEYEGDKRTPEGTYTLDYIKEKSRFYKAFHISYPNQEDIRHARSLGRRPGGMIMVHGQPASKSEYHDALQRSDWTNGCIALLNPEMDEFISLVDVGTPIQINP
ncbi:MAG: L,D-transpeptidase family protein [Succinivibrio sp.]|nr:L,D-transpeptidase family protein [Succinivibrio sp.]